MKARSLLAVALCLLGCGSTATWTPPPSAQLPVAPPPKPKKKTVKATAPAAPAPPAPIPGDLPEGIDAKLVVHATCEDKDCLIPGLYPAGAAADGGAPAAMWSHDLPEKGVNITLPRHSGVDLYGLVLSGNVRLKPLEGGAKTIDLAPWGVFRAPGAGVTLIASEGAARLVLAIVGDTAPIAETAALLKERKTLKQVAWRGRPSAIQTLDLKADPDLAWGNGAMHRRMGFADGRASFGVLMASQDAPVPAHVHESSWEVLAALSADGTAKRASAAGETEMAEIAVTDGTVVAIPKGTRHAWSPSGKKPLVAVQLYLPPGPEQRFKELAEKAASK